MKRIGMIVPSLDNSFFSSLSYYTQRFMAAHDYVTLTVSSNNSAEIEKEAFRALIASGVSGIICASGLSRLPSDLIPDDFPLVWVDRIPSSERTVPWVANDDADAMEKAAEHLIEKGCRHLLLMPGFIAEKQDNPRVRGFQRALEKHGIPFDPSCVLSRTGKESSEKETGDLITRVIKSGIKVDGIITSSDRAAFGVIKALVEIGYFVPEDIRLISFDNSPYSSFASPAITALDRKPDMLSQRAGEVLICLMENSGPVQTENTIPVELVTRLTTR